MEKETIIPDFSHLTCTNLMIKLKILSKRMKSGEILEFYSTREQLANIKKPFSKLPFQLEIFSTKNHLFHIKISYK
ncbi:MAG: hypothetical protein ACTSWC_02240 [Promethearchaeota archaeon]